jgi:hypothetical protein
MQILGSSVGLGFTKQSFVGSLTRGSNTFGANGNPSGNTFIEVFRKKEPSACPPQLIELMTYLLFI